MQIMPETGWAQCGLTESQLLDPLLNLNCGVSYFVKLLRRFKSVSLALCAYNSGPGRVAQLQRCPRIRETIEYSRNILTNWQQEGR
jgi:soluble lytic murein transglycosylase-like protein